MDLWRSPVSGAAWRMREAGEWRGGQPTASTIRDRCGAHWRGQRSYRCGGVGVEAMIGGDRETTADPERGSR